MKRNSVHAGLIATMLILTMISLPARASQCSQASAAGNWAYTYTGTVFAPNALPAAAVGHFHEDAKGNVTGSQTHTLAGETEVEDITGTATVNSDCTGKRNHQRLSQRSAPANRHPEFGIRQRRKPRANDFHVVDAGGRHSSSSGGDDRRESRVHQELMRSLLLPIPEWRRDCRAGQANSVKARARDSGDLVVGLDRVCDRAKLPLSGAGRGSKSPFQD